MEVEKRRKMLRDSVLDLWMIRPCLCSVPVPVPVASAGAGAGRFEHRWVLLGSDKRQGHTLGTVGSGGILRMEYEEGLPPLRLLLLQLLSRCCQSPPSRCSFSRDIIYCYSAGIASFTSKNLILFAGSSIAL